VRLLLHICCGPCASGAIPHWRKDAHEVVGFFCNPNIHPLLEQRRRLTGAHEASEQAGTALVVDGSYDPVAWFSHVSADGESRCALCIGQRLRRTAEEGLRQRCDAFSTTLSISPYQDHLAIQEQGRMVEKELGLQFIYEDLRPLYRESRRLARERGIYRQKYCGCLVSEWERYRDRR
jgi:predicted adenine nucleotide alpha hydrolase (AANH) superfamily ATPase